MHSTVAILSSGGMDSFLVWARYTRADPSAALINVFVDIGQKYVEKERAAWTELQGQVPGFDGVGLKALYLRHLETPSGIIPNRNAHLILAAATISPRIAMGILAGEINSDKSANFIQAMELALDISNLGQYWNGGRGIRHSIERPLMHSTKSQAVSDYLRAGGSPSLLLKTISCYSADDGHCGACPSCFKRWIALTNNGLNNTGFHSHPPTWAEREGVLEKAKDGTYGLERAGEINNALSIAGWGRA